MYLEFKYYLDGWLYTVVWREIGVLLATFEAPLRRRVGHDLTTLTLKTVAVVAPVIMIVASQGI